MVPGKAAKPWTLQGHRAEPAEHWLSRAGGGSWQKGREKVTSSLARPKGWQGGGCRGTPCLPRPTMAPARSALRAWGRREPCIPWPQLQATSPATGEKAPGSLSPTSAGGSREGQDTPGTLPSPPFPPSDGPAPPAPHPGARSAMADQGAPCRDSDAVLRGIWLSPCPFARSPAGPHGRAARRP